jgi:hypothetical protein
VRCYVLLAKRSQTHKRRTVRTIPAKSIRTVSLIHFKFKLSN